MNNNIHIIRLEKEGEVLEAAGPANVLSEFLSSLRAKGFKVVLKKA